MGTVGNQDNVRSLMCFDFGLPFASMAVGKGKRSFVEPIVDAALELHFARVYVLISQNLIIIDHCYLLVI